MKTLALLALVVIAAASRFEREERSEWLNRLVPNQKIEETHYRPNREYTFFYNGQLTTGIPGASQQHSATRIQALVSLVFKSHEKVLLQLKHVRFGRLNEQIREPRSIKPFEAFEKVDIESELEESLKVPIKFTYKQGVITDIVFDGEEQPWSANIKRGVLNMLQINLNKEREIHNSPSHLRSEIQSEKLDSFFTMEKSIEGECETLYTISPETENEISSEEESLKSSDKLRVTKSINFENCERRPEIRYNHHFEQICPSCEGRFTKEERSLRSSSVGTFKLRCESAKDKKCVIKESAMDSQYHFVLFNEESSMISTYVRQTLELVKTSEIESEIREPRNTIKSDSDMVYSLDWDIKKERFFLEGEEEFQSKTPFSKMHNKVEFVEEILRKLVLYTRDNVKEEAPRQFARLVRVLRMLKREQIEQLNERFCLRNPEGFTNEEHKKIKELLVDAIAMAGTNDCVSFLVEAINKNEIPVSKGASLIRKLMDTRVVSKQMVERVMSLLEKSERHPTLKQAVMLTWGSMMNTMCDERKQNTWAVEFKPESRRNIECTEEIKEKFVKKMMALFHKSENTYQEILVLKSLSNAGFDVMIKPLEKIIYNKEGKYSIPVRTEAILALRKLADQIPNKITKVLLPIYMSKREPTELRITAFYQIMKCMPDKLVIDQLSNTLRKERNVEVTSFCFSMFEHLANSTEPCEQRMADDIKLSLRLTRYSRNWSYSKYVRVFETRSRDKKMASQVEYASIMSSSSPIPKTMAFMWNVNAMSKWSPRFVSVSVKQSGLGRVLNRLWRSHSHKFQSSLNDLLSGKFEMPSPRFNYRSELKSIFEKLNINEREFESEESKFLGVDLKFKNNDYGFIPLSEEMIPEELKSIFNGDNTVNELVKNAERLLRDVSIPFRTTTGTFMHEQSRKIPTTLGLPIQVSVKIPTIMQASGVLKVEVDAKNPLKKVKVIVKEMKPSFVSTVVAKMECWSPIVNTGVKVVGLVKAFAPFEGSLQIDMTKSSSQIKMTVSPINNKREEIFSIQTRPSTFSLVWPKFLKKWEEPEERTIHGSEWTRVHRHDYEFGEHSLGVTFNSRSYWHVRPEEHVSSTPTGVMCGPNKYSLTIEKGYEQPKEFIMTIEGNLLNNVENKKVNVAMNEFFKGSAEKYFLSESSEESSSSSSSSETNENTISEESYSSSSSSDSDSKTFSDEMSRSSSSSSEETNENTISAESSSSSEEKNRRRRNNNYFKTYRGENPTNNEIKVELSTRGSSIKRQAELKANCMCDEQMKACKCKLIVERTPVPTKETKPWKFSTELEILYPETPMSLNELTSEKRLMGSLKTKWGSETEKIFDVKMVAEQSREMNRLSERSLYKRMSDKEEHRNNYRSLFSPVGQYKYTKRYGFLDEIKFDIDYKMPIESQETLYNWFNMLKNKYYSQSYTSITETSKSREGRVLAKINVDPNNKRYMDLVVRTPDEKVVIESMPVPFEIESILNMRRISSPSTSMYGLFSSMTRLSRPVCESRTNRIRTFDDVETHMPTSTCYSVLAKDCSSSETGRFAVLVKKQSESTEKKTLKIITENQKLVIKATSNDELECEINNERKPCSEINRITTTHKDHVVVRMQKRGRMVEIELVEAGIKVYFDGFATDIKVSPMYRSQVCGLCGEFDLDTENEFVNARKERVSRREMLESYLFKEEEKECKHEFEEESKELTFDRSYERDLFNSNEDMTPYYGRSQIRPRERTLIVEQAHELCFSKRPVAKCPRGTYTIEREEKEERVVFTCLPRNSRKAEKLERLVRQKNVDITRELTGLTDKFTETERLPKMCRRG